MTATIPTATATISERRPADDPGRGARLLGQAVEAFDSDDLAHADGEGLGAELVAMRGAIDRLEAQFSRRLVRFDTVRGYERAGAADLISWLRWACRMGTSAAARRLHLARQLTELPETEAAWRRGSISTGHASVIGRTVDEMGDEGARAAEATLLEAAEQTNPGHVWLIGQRLRHSLDRERARADANAMHARRRLHITRGLDGGVSLDGLFDPEAGAVLRTAIDALTRPLPNDDRIAPQRRADALVELARRQLDGGALPGAGGQRPHLSLTVPATALRREEGSPPAELDWAGPIIDETARRLSCDAVCSTVDVDEEGMPLTVGRATRTVPPSIRRALVLRDRGCRFPGCDRPPQWTDGHHLVHWADGGQTALENLVLLCRPHHRLVHEQGWTLRRDGEGEVVAEPP
ncbi:MAG: DUF222 domain-containing protein [Candidatus Dormibacteria bacterium]